MHEYCVQVNDKNQNKKKAGKSNASVTKQASTTSLIILKYCVIIEYLAFNTVDSKFPGAPILYPTTFCWQYL